MSTHLQLPSAPFENRVAATDSAEVARLESLRLESLRAHQILDTPPEAAFDRVTALAARWFGVPMAAVSLIDAERQWFKSAIGLDVCQTLREVSFCSHAIEKTGVLVVPDTHLDARFATNELVVGEPLVRFYAGAPLVGRDGLALGALCLLDVVPRNLDAQQCQTLAELAAIVVDELELRRAARQLREADTSRLTVQKALFDSQTRFKSAFDMSANGMALVSPAGQFLQVNQRLCEMLGYDETQLLKLTFQDITVPDDLSANLELLNRLLAGEISNYNLIKRYLRFDGTRIWVSIGVALVRDEAGAPAYLVAQVQDISERKQIEDELRQSEARKAAILETALDCIITIDAESRILEWNPAAEKTFGFSRLEAISQPLHHLIIPETLRAAHRAGLENWKASGDGPILGKRLELPAVRKDGTPLTVELAVVPIPGTEPPLFTGHLRDISERRRADERLRLLESVAVNANDAILITEAEPLDLPGPRILYANEAYLRMTGYTEEDLIGQTPRISQGPGTTQESRDAIRSALKRWKPIVIELLNKKKDGTPFWVELSIVPVADESGWYTHWVSIQRDVTERRRINDALKESEGRYGRIAANVPGMVYQLVMAPDCSFRFPFVSEGSREIYNLEPAQVMADATLIIGLAHPDDANELHESILRSAQTLEAWEWEGRILAPGHDLKWIRGTSRPKREENGEIVWDGILFDVTARKKQEEALQNAKNEAEFACVEAERANVAKSEFLSRMSHELRTPLNAILGFGQLLEMSDLPPEDAESAEQILGAGRHLLGLINEVLDIARIEAGQLALSPEPVGVAEIGHETLDLVRPLMAARGLSLDDAAIRACELYVRADRQRLKQILLNLLSNAVKYNSQGGRITLSCQVCEGNRVRIGVRDRGAGIAPSLQNRLFTAFDRLGAEQSAIEGTGVGLALSQRLALAMDGIIAFESFDSHSEGGPGSLFWIELPGADSPMQGLEPVPGAPETAVMVNTELVVLYVEDNPSNLQLVQRLLERRPEIRLLTAMQGRMGVDLARQHCPDLILLDMNLPDIKGENVLRLIRGDEVTGSIPVVVVSADATTSQIARMMAAGAENYLTKPFDVREFMAILNSNIVRKQSENAAWASDIVGASDGSGGSPVADGDGAQLLKTSDLL